MSSQIRNSIFNLSEGSSGSRNWTQRLKALFITQDSKVKITEDNKIIIYEHS
jgi:hypothetical protein